MNIWLLAALGLAAAGLVPGVIRAASGDSLQRLVGLQLVGAVATMIVIALAMAVQQGSYLIVAVVLVLVAAAGTLVFTRLLGSADRDEPDDERVGENSG